jgi:hypothetical protein
MPFISVVPLCRAFLAGATARRQNKPPAPGIGPADEKIGPQLGRRRTAGIVSDQRFRREQQQIARDVRVAWEMPTTNISG